MEDRSDNREDSRVGWDGEVGRDEMVRWEGEDLSGQATIVVACPRNIIETSSRGLVGGAKNLETGEA